MPPEEMPPGLPRFRLSAAKIEESGKVGVVMKVEEFDGDETAGWLPGSCVCSHRGAFSQDCGGAMPGREAQATEAAGVGSAG